MNWRVIAALAAGLAVAGCGGNPLGNEPEECEAPPFATPGDCPDDGGGDGGGDGDGDGDGGLEIPEELRGNLQSVAYNKAAGTLTVQIDPLGTGGQPLAFTRAPQYDQAGYQAFTYQNTDSSRFFVALFDTSDSGSVTAGVAGSGQLTEMVWGSAYAVNEAFTRPTGAGIATYSGSYSGLINGGPVQDPNLPPGTPAEPIRPARVTGDVVINADFNAPTSTTGQTGIEGTIRNRQLENNGGALDDVFLQIAEINPDGTFGGTVTFQDQSPIGSYAGTFGGVGGDAVAGAIEITPVRTQGDLLERGVFVADRCTAGQASPCPSAP